MNKVKTFVVTALAAATVGTGALAAAPSASAAPPSCGQIYLLAERYYHVWDALVSTGYGETQTAAYYKGMYMDYFRAAAARGC